jgi:hypothetical protein
MPFIRGGFPNPKDPWCDLMPFYSCEDLEEKD